MSKHHGEHPVWVQINYKMGLNAAFDGERERPQYIGEITDFSSGDSESDDSSRVHRNEPEPTG